VHAIVPPLSLCGPVLNIRKFSSVPLGPADLLANGTLGHRMLTFLAACVRGRLNIVISGGTSSGKTTLLGVLSSFVPREERLITIEDAAELRLAQPHVIGLRPGPPASRVAVRSPCAISFGTRSACDQTGSWSARSEVVRPSTCSRR
jgi:pilus assembly protein CpaF